MKIVYTITKKDAWAHHWRIWLFYPLRFTIRFCSVPVIACALCYLADVGLPIIILVLLVTGILPFIILLLIIKSKLPRVSAVKEETTEEYIAEIGKFDFRFGPLSSPVYYHWTRFTDIEEADDCFYLMLRNRRPFRVPKKAFGDRSSFDAFLAEAIARWKATQMRQIQMTVPQNETVWPPAPRPANAEEP